MTNTPRVGRIIALLCLGALSHSAWAQYAIVSQSRSVSVDDGNGNHSADEAPGQGAYSKVITSGDVLTSRASQDSIVSSSVLAGSGSASRSWFFGSANSLYHVVFTTSTQFAVAVNATLNGSSLTLTGPGLSMSTTAPGGTTLVVFQAGQQYTLDVSTAPLCCASATSASWDFAIQPIGDMPVTAMTYQGRLTDANGQSFNGAADVRFRLLDAANNQLGQTVTRTNLQVHSGLFTTDVDFGVIPGSAPVSIEIAARVPAGAGTYTVLAPTTPLRAAPLATFAGAASFASAALSATTARSLLSDTASALQDNQLRLRDKGDSAHGLGWFGGSQTFFDSGLAPDGPVLWGFNSGALATVTDGAAKIALRWDTSGHVGIGTAPSASYVLELPNVAGPGGQGHANAWVTYSSREYKRNIETLTDPLGAVMQLRGVSFEWAAPNADGGHTRDIGFIAEEVAQVLPQLVTCSADGKATGLDYGRIVPVAVEAIKRQQSELDAIKSENTELRARLDRLEAAMLKGR